MKPAAFEYRRAESVTSAGADLIRPSLETQSSAHRLAPGDARAPDETRIIAGGQTLGPMMNLRLARPAVLIDVSRLPELREVRQTADSVVFGAAVTHAEIEDGRHPDPVNGGMREVAAGIAYRVVRNRGTIGGSVAHADPAADWLSFLSVTGATVHLAGPGGNRVLAMHDFVLTAYTTALEPGEIVAAVEVPRCSAGACFGYHKLCRKVGEFADAIGAVLIDPGRRSCRVVAGAVAPAPLHLTGAAADIARSATIPTVASIEAELDEAVPDADPVRLHMGAVAVHRAVERAWRR